VKYEFSHHGSASGNVTRGDALPDVAADMRIPMEEVSGRVAFITGGSSGIGLGIARAFVDAGMKVAISYRTKRHLEQAMRCLGSAREHVHAIDVDVTDRSGMERAAEEVVRKFGKVHVLVNNAGVVYSGTLRHTTYDDWDWVMSVNVDGVFNGVRAFLPQIQAHREGGQIIATASIMGLCAFGGNAAAYSVSKFAVVGLMEVLRAELADTDIGVSVFCPGVVSSDVRNSDRNRPSHWAETGCKADAQGTSGQAEHKENPDAMDPFEAGRLVLRGMRNNDLYILSHPEYEQMFRKRHEVLVASTPTDLQPSESRLDEARSWLRRSIYAAEDSRQRSFRPVD
jgi:NAD(P)-dependent dehydrogenase (short-subunit alcohol dehydrogenase family)